MRIDKLRHALGGSDITIKAAYDACRSVRLFGSGSFIECVGNDPADSFGKLRLTVNINDKIAAWAELTLIKPFSAMPTSVAVRRVSLLDALPYSPDIDASMVEAVLELDVKSAGRLYSIDGASTLVIVDKVYVEPAARRCGISEYIHDNLADIVHVYSGYRPTLAVLNCGDFAEESKSQGLSNVGYKDMLYAHYTKCGYETALGAAKSVVSKYVMWRVLR